jgi:hypothetical protein
VRPLHSTSTVADLHPEVEMLCKQMWDSFERYPEL